MIKPDKEKLVADEFILDKSEMNSIFSGVASHWKRDDLSMLQNAGYVTNMELIKTAVKFNDTKVLAHLYFSIIQAVEQIQTLNSLKKSWIDSKNSEENENITKQFHHIYSIQLDKIKSGEAFIKN